MEKSDPIAGLEASLRALREQVPAERRDATVSLQHDPDPALLPLLRRTLDDEDDYIRASAIYALSQYDLGDEPGISQALLHAIHTDPDDTVRAAAAYVLPLIGDKAQEALIAALADASVQVREKAAHALGAFDSKAATAALRRCLRGDPNAEVRLSAVFGLEGIGVEHAVDDLLRALHDESPAVRAITLRALHNSDLAHGNPTCVEAFIQCLADPEALVREAAAGALRYSMPIAIPALINALSDSAPTVRIEALLALGSLDADEAVEAMAGCLHRDPDEEVRAYAVSALEDLHTPSAAEHLTKALDDESARVRSDAALALGDVSEAPHGPVVQALCKALGDTHAEVREMAAKALERQFVWSEPDWDTALEPLCVAARDRQPQVRAAAIEALGGSRDPRALAVITQALDDEEIYVKAQAVESLAGIAPSLCLEQVPLLLANPDVTLQRAVIKALRWMDGTELLPEVLSYLSDDNRDACAREQIAELIASRGGPVYVPALLSALSTKADFLRATVVKALGAAADRRVVPTLIGCLRDEADCVRADAALALAAIGDEQALQPLERSILDAAPSVRRSAVWALSFFEPAKVQALLVRAVEDVDEHVQSTAVAALAAICDARNLRRIRSSLPRSQDEIRKQLEEAAITLDRDWGGQPSGETRSVHRGTIHYE